MINEIKEDIKSIKLDLAKLTNHYSKRLPVWASILFMILTAMIGGLIGRALF